MLMGDDEDGQLFLNLDRFNVFYNMVYLST